MAITALALRRVGSLDVGFHLAAGERMLAGHGWPRTDPFTFTVPDHAWIDTSWGYQLLVALAHRAGGPTGIGLLHATALLSAFALLLRTARVAGAPALPAALLLGLGGLASELRFEARPEHFSWLFLAGLLHVLSRHASGLRGPLWALPLLLLGWINVHGGLWVLGAAALGAFAVGLSLRDRRVDRPLLAWSAAALAATLVNPYGWAGARFPLVLATRMEEQNPFAQSISEFVSPLAMGPSAAQPHWPWLPVRLWECFGILALFAIPTLARRRRFPELLLLLAFLPLSLQMMRNMPLLVLAALPGTAVGLAGDSSASTQSPATRRPREALAAAACAAVLLFTLRVATDAYYVGARRGDRTGLGWNRSVLPVDATDFVRRAGISGPVLNHLNFGAWLAWAGPGKTFIDGRLEVMGEEFYAHYTQVLADEAATEREVGRHDIRWAIVPYAQAPKLTGRLSADPKWRLAWFDAVAAVFVREGPGAEAWVDPSAAAALRPAPRPPAASAANGSAPAFAGGACATPLRPGDPSGGRLSRWFSGFVRAPAYPHEALQRGIFHLYRGELAQAEARFGDAVAEGGSELHDPWQNLGAVLWRQGRRADAAYCYRQVLALDPANGTAWKRLREMGAD